MISALAAGLSGKAQLKGSGAVYILPAAVKLACMILSILGID